MPRFFFHTKDGKTVPDETGVELSDARQACIQGTQLVGEMLRDDPNEFWETEALSLTVTNADGLTLFTILVAGIASPAIGPGAG